MRRANVAQLYISHVLTKAQTWAIESPFPQLCTLKYPFLQQNKILRKGLDANTLVYIRISSLQNKSQVAKIRLKS